jgi:thiosulfate dehydrogenase [quinone] large subunit
MEDDMYAPVANELAVDRATAKVAVLGAMYGQTTGEGARALKRREAAYLVAMAYLTKADRSGQAGRDLRTYGGRSEAQAEVGSSSADEGGHNVRVANWLYRSREASSLWLVVRLWLGYQWMNAGYQKIWGREHTAFISGSGAGVKGFAAAGIVGSTAGKGGASYGWWAAFLHNFVVPNASWIGQFISIAELLIGLGLLLGFLTGYAALAGLALNLIYMFTRSAGVNPAYAVLSVFLVRAWRNAGWIGLDRFILRNTWTPHLIGRITRHRPPVPAVAR